MQKATGARRNAPSFARHGGGDLQEALAACEVGLKARTERIAPPGHTGRLEAGSAEQ
jgi:hypothetical protein